MSQCNKDVVYKLDALLLQITALAAEKRPMTVLGALDNLYLQVEHSISDWMQLAAQEGSQHTQVWLSGALFLEKFCSLYQQTLVQMGSSLLVSHLIFIRLLRFSYCWSHINYDPSLVGKYWAVVYQIYQSFSSQRGDQLALISQGTTIWQSSLEYEISSLLLLSVSSLESLPLYQFSLALQVIEKAAQWLVIVNPRDSDVLFYCDMSKSLLPKRVFSHDSLSEQYSCFNLLLTSEKLKHICHSLSQDMGSTDLHIMQSIQLLFMKQWKLDGQFKRGYERCKIDKKKVQYLIGYNSLKTVFQLDPRIYKSDQLSTAEIIDMSVTGFGLLLDKLDDRSMSVGALLTIMMPDAVSWRVGLVRRIQRVEQNSFVVGVEVLSGAPMQGFVCVNSDDLSISYPSVVMPDYQVSDNSIAILIEKSQLDCLMAQHSVLHIMEAFFLRMLTLCSVFYVGVDSAIIICSYEKNREKFIEE